MPLPYRVSLSGGEHNSGPHSANSSKSNTPRRVKRPAIPGNSSSNSLLSSTTPQLGSSGSAAYFGDAGGRDGADDVRSSPDGEANGKNRRSMGGSTAARLRAFLARPTASPLSSAGGVLSAFPAWFFPCPLGQRPSTAFSDTVGGPASLSPSEGRSPKRVGVRQLGWSGLKLAGAVLLVAVLSHSLLSIHLRHQLQQARALRDSASGEGLQTYNLLPQHERKGVGQHDGTQAVVRAVGSDRVQERPIEYFDMVFAVFSSNTEDGRAKRDILRVVYDRYGGWAHVDKRHHVRYSLKVVFVVGRPAAPEEGLLVGDMFYVDVAKGYKNIVQKTKKMMYLAKHLDFQYLMKGDDDTFVCFDRLASFLHTIPLEKREKIYAGVPTVCDTKNPRDPIGKVIMDPNDKWYDEAFISHTLEGMNCYPVYMQGAFYLISKGLVDHLVKGMPHYVTFANEDVTIGSWLFGVDREIAEMSSIKTSRLWDCMCSLGDEMPPRFRYAQIFFHNCKEDAQIIGCVNALAKVRC